MRQTIIKKNLEHQDFITDGLERKIYNDPDFIDLVNRVEKAVKDNKTKQSILCTAIATFLYANLKEPETDIGHEAGNALDWVDSIIKGLVPELQENTTANPA